MGRAPNGMSGAKMNRRSLGLILGFTFLGCGTPTQPMNQPHAASSEGLADSATDRGPSWAGQWMLNADRRVVLSEGGNLAIEHGGVELCVIQNVLGIPSIAQGVSAFAYSRRTDDGTEIWLHDGAAADPCAGTVLEGGSHDPDRVALAEDGSRIAWVAASATGIAAVFYRELPDGDVVQLTNHGVRRKGQPPANFVAPPHRSPPIFEGNRLVWDAPDGAHSVVIP